MGKRILVFCGGSFVFGAEIVTLSILEVLISNGFRVHCVVSGWNDGVFIKRLKELNIPHTEVKLGFFYMTKPLWTLDSLVHYPMAMYKIYKLINWFKPDFVHHVTYRSIISAYPLIKNLKNYLFVFDPHFGSLNRKYFQILNKVLFMYISVSRAIKINLVEIGATKDRIEVIHNGIKLNKEIVKSKVNFPLKFGIIGQIIPRKGHIFLIKAIAILRDKHYQFSLEIIGSGEHSFILQLKEEIKKYGLEENVNFIGFITNRDDLFEHLDIVIVPSITPDPLPTSAMEAGLYFKPTIVTDIGGLPEIVINNKTGIIVPPESETELASAMEQFILFPKLIDEYGRFAHDHITQNFNVEKNILKLIELLKQNE